jgi:hypothetical protein
VQQRSGGVDADGAAVAEEAHHEQLLRRALVVLLPGSGGADGADRALDRLLESLRDGALVV